MREFIVKSNDKRNDYKKMNFKLFLYEKKNKKYPYNKKI